MLPEKNMLKQMNDYEDQSQFHQIKLQKMNQGNMKYKRPKEIITKGKTYWLKTYRLEEEK